MSTINDVPALKTVGAQAGNSPVTFTALPPISTLTGAVNVPNRPSGATQPGVSGSFLATFTGPLTGPVSLTLTLPSVGGWVPGDIIRTLITPPPAAQTLAVIDGGTGTPTLAALPTTLTSSGYIDAQLNETGTHWTFLGAGGV